MNLQTAQGPALAGCQLMLVVTAPLGLGAGTPIRGLGFLTKWQPGSRGKYPEADGSYTVTSNLTSHVTQRHGHHILYVRNESPRQIPNSRGGQSDSTF